MPGSRIATRDARDGQPLALIGDASVRWTSGTRWDGVVAERLDFERFEPPEFDAPDHCLIVPLAPVAVEFQEQGRFRLQRMVPGDLALFSAGAPRRLRHGRAELLAIALSRPLVARVALEIGRSADAELVERHCVRDARAEPIARALAAEAEAGFPSGSLYGESLGLALAVHLIAAHGSARPKSVEHRGGLAPQCLKRVTCYMHEHLADELRLVTLAEIASLSPHRFAHNFKQATGIAPHQWLVRARLERARTLLRETDRSIATIACATGFASPSRFTASFRRAMGLTPSAYRTSCR